MAADKVPPSRAFVTAAQSLQHLETNARLGDARHEATMSGDAPTKVYQQTPRDDRDDDEGGSRLQAPPGRGGEHRPRRA